MITHPKKKIIAIAAALIANCSLLKALAANPVSVQLPADSSLTEIVEVDGSLEIISDGVLLRNIPIEEVSDLTLYGMNRSSDIDVSTITHLSGSLNIEGDVGSVTFHGPVAIGGATTVVANGTIRANASFSSNAGITFNAGNQIQLNNSEMTTLAGNVNFFSFSDTSLINSSINKGDSNSSITDNIAIIGSNVFIRTNGNLSLVDSSFSITNGNLSTNVATSMSLLGSAITATNSNLYLNINVDMIIDAESTLQVTGGDLYANIFGEAVLAGIVNIEQQFAMYTRGDFMLMDTGSLDASIIYLSASKDIAIDGRADTNKFNGQIYLNAKGSVDMKSIDPITSEVLHASSVTGIFLRTDVEQLTVQTGCMVLGNDLGSKKIEIYEVDDVVLKTVYNADGPILIMAGGTIKAVEVLSDTDAPGRNISLMSTGGDIEAGLVRAGAAQGQISLSARGEIKELPDYDMDFDIVGSVAKIYAGASISSGDVALEIDVNELDEREKADMFLWSLISMVKSKRTEGGELVQTVLAGDRAIVPEVVAALGYPFTGWDIAFDTLTMDLRVTRQVKAVPKDAIRLHQGFINNVSDGLQTVDLPYSYDSMVLVCTVNLPSASASPVVPRVRNASGNSFEVKVQNPSDLNAVTSCTVHYLVVEEGQYTLTDDGVQMEAVKFESTVNKKGASPNAHKPIGKMNLLMLINGLCILFKIHSVCLVFANRLQVHKRLWLCYERGTRSVTHLSALLCSSEPPATRPTRSDRTTRLVPCQRHFWILWDIRASDSGSRNCLRHNCLGMDKTTDRQL